MKICNKCNDEKEISEYYIKKNGSPRAYCKDCTLKDNTIYRIKNKDRDKEYFKNYRTNNKEKLSEASKIYYLNNKEVYAERDKKYYSKKKEYRENNKERVKTISKKSREKNKDRNKIKKREWIKNKRKNNFGFRLKSNISRAINRYIKDIGGYKKNKTLDILGCTIEDFKFYIESKFEYWMSWENYGKYNGEFKYGWDFDHIIPISNANTEEEIIKLNHYTNFQPLCSYINRYIKKNRTDFDILEIKNYNETYLAGTKSVK